MLRSQDLLVCLKLALLEHETWTFEGLAEEVGLSTSETYQAVKRLRKSGLLQGKSVNKRALSGFLEHGVRHVFYAERGAPSRGVPTGAAAPPLNDLLGGSSELAVWPDPHGSERGYALKPLYRSAPRAAKRDKHLYELLALVDAVRDGGTRERSAAIDVLRQRLG